MSALISSHLSEVYIGGTWRRPVEGRLIEVIDPSTEEPFAHVAAAGASDADLAVAAATAAFDSYSRTSRRERILLLGRVKEEFEARRDDLCETMSREMGVPISAARTVHFPSGPAHLDEIIRVLEHYAFDDRRGTTMVAREPIGVCALITPWNFPINQLVVKIAPALAAGCTMVLKPSEIAPISALIIAEIMHDAGVPAGVFNLLNGTGPEAGAALAAHPGVQMVSFTGSTQAGISVARAAAGTVKRVTQELGGKAANILLPDADFEKAVPLGVARCFNNSGQSCISPTRMLVPHTRLDQVAELAARTAASIKVGPVSDPDSTLGPVSSRAQFEKVQRLIETGIREGCQLAAGGPGRPSGLQRGFFVRPTVFADVRPDATIGVEEIFGPVLSVIGYRDQDDAIEIANATPYGLASYVQSADPERARAVARRLRTGIVHINHPPVDRAAPFGGYKQSGNGREWGVWGLEEYLEVKAMVGYGAEGP